MARKKAVKKTVAKNTSGSGADLQRVPTVPEMPLTAPDAEGVIESPPNYGTFYQAWKHVKELRRRCTQEGRPRFGLKGEDLVRAKKLIREYKNG